MHPVRYTPRDSRRFRRSSNETVLLVVSCAAAIPQAVCKRPGAQPAAAPDPDATLRYIHAAWDTLTRSMTDCHSLADIKIDSKAAANPVLYLPAELPRLRR